MSQVNTFRNQVVARFTSFLDLEINQLTLYIPDMPINPVKVSKALSDKNRLKILEMLGETPRNVGDVAERLNVEENLASHHLRVLSSLGFLKSRRKGREVYYDLNKTRFVTLVRTLSKNEAFRQILQEALKDK